jgi:hypothetical protein
MGGIYAPVYQLEQMGTRAEMRVTGNVFLYPQNGIGTAMQMPTGIPTTSWAPNGPWVGGLVAGNFASGASSAPGAPPAWYIHHDLTGAGNIGQILPEDSSRSRTAGWYPCNGAPLSSLDSGTNLLARVNATKCGFSSGLPLQPGNVVRLHGPLQGEGLLADSLSRYAGTAFKGSSDTDETLRAVPRSELSAGDIRVVRHPLGVFVWDPDQDTVLAPTSSLQPLEVSEGADRGMWVPFNAGLDLLADDADIDGDGFTNRQERAFLGDPAQAGGGEPLSLQTAADGTLSVSFRCTTGFYCPRICLQSSEDMIDWHTETSCTDGGSFAQPAAGTVTESPFLTGRAVTFTPGSGDRRFWRLVLDP